MPNRIRNFFLLTFLLIGSIATAQDTNVNEGFMRSNGKIYVVLAVCLTILIGLFIYLFTIDRKIGKIEDKQ
ncbi:MAG: CcmD family protein [Bacteroidota bacterium]|nr:CcmD family protein [Ferruginibacter sp.]